MDSGWGCSLDFQYQFGNETTTVRLEKTGAEYAVRVNGQRFTVTVEPRAQGELTLLINGQRYTAHIAAEGARRWMALNGQTFELIVPQAQKKTRRDKAGGHESLEAQMPGLVRQVLVAEGEAVTQGQTLLTLEAMKMEIRVNAPHAGTVEKVGVRAGETVARGQVLIQLNE
jgi:biotin carboxyl carrier protein